MGASLTLQYGRLRPSSNIQFNLKTHIRHRLIAVKTENLYFDCIAFIARFSKHLTSSTLNVVLCYVHDISGRRDRIPEIKKLRTCYHLSSTHNNHCVSVVLLLLCYLFFGKVFNKCRHNINKHGVLGRTTIKVKMVLKWSCTYYVYHYH